MPSIPLLIVDDIEHAYIYMKRLAAQKGFESIWNRQINTERAFNDLTVWLRSEKVPEELVVILDLGLWARAEFPNGWESANAVRNWDVLASSVANECNGGLAILRTILEECRAKKVLVMVASGATFQGIPVTVSNIQKKGYPGKRTSVHIEVTLPTAKDDEHGFLLTRARDLWNTAFPPELHKDTAIDNLLTTYGKPWTCAGFPSGFAWQHPNLTYPIDLWKAHVGPMLNSWDENAAQALCMSETIQSVNPEGATIQSHYRDTCQPRSREISIENLRSVFTRSGLSVELEDADNAMFRFPVSPGIAFLCSLKELVGSLAPDDSNGSRLMMRILQGVGPRAKEDVYALTLKLGEQHKGEAVAPMEHLIRSIEQNWESPNGPQKEGGVPSAIHNLVRCKSAYCEKAALPPNKRWLSLFTEGTSGPVMHTSFSDHTIEFLW